MLRVNPGQRILHQLGAALSPRCAHRRFIERPSIQLGANLVVQRSKPALRLGCCRERLHPLGLVRQVLGFRFLLARLLLLLGQCFACHLVGLGFVLGNLAPGHIHSYGASPRYLARNACAVGFGAVADHWPRACHHLPELLTTWDACHLSASCDCSHAPA